METEIKPASRLRRPYPASFTILLAISTYPAGAAAGGLTLNVKRYMMRE